MKLARAIHFDDSDRNVYASTARTGEWCLPGGFEFSDWTDADLTGKAKQAFTNGWLGIETMGRTSFVAITEATEAEVDSLTDLLARQFQALYGAPSVEAARPEAEQQIADMADLCAEHDPNTLLTVTRTLTENGVHETFRAIAPNDADLLQFAVHGDADLPGT